MHTLRAFPAVLLLVLAGCAGAEKADPDKLTPEQMKQRGLVASRRSSINDITWHEVKRYTFGNPSEIDLFVQPEGAWKIADGKLVAVEGKRNRVIMLCPSEYEPVRVQFDAMLHPNPDGEARDFTVLIGATADANFFRSGYTLTTGSYFNNTTCFYRLGRKIARTEYSPLVVNKRYRVTVEVARGHIRYWLDDKIILEAWDAMPLTWPLKSWIGLRTWDIRMEVDNVVISRGQY